MTVETRTVVERYLEDPFVREDAALSSSREASREAGSPDIQVSPSQGKFFGCLPVNP